MTEISEARIAEIRERAEQGIRRCEDIPDLLAALDAARAGQSAKLDQAMNSVAEGWQVMLNRVRKDYKARALAAEAERDRMKADLAIATGALKRLDRRGDALETFDLEVHEIVTLALIALEPS